MDMFKTDSATKLAPRNSAANIKGGDFVTQQFQDSPIMNANCSHCETMLKNLQYLENYLRNNTAKNSCNSCATCLSFLLYMKQQCLPLCPTIAGITECYTMEQNLNNQQTMKKQSKDQFATNTTAAITTTSVTKKPISKSTPTISKASSASKANILRTKVSGRASNKMATTMTGLPKQRLEAALSKKRLTAGAKKTMTTKMSAAPSKTISKSISGTLATTKSATSKEESIKKRKRKIRSRPASNPERKRPTIKKKVKISDA